MLRTILAGLDGTPSSESVLSLGIQWAGRHDALLVGIAIIDEPGLHGPEEWMLGQLAFARGHNEQLVHELSRKAEQILAGAAVRCARERVAFKPLEEIGDPYAEIPIQAHRFDLILLGQETHFQFGFERRADDTLTRVLRTSPRPVVIVPRTLGPGAAVVVAFDGSIQASRALASFEALGLARQRTVHVFSAAAEHRRAAGLADRAVEFLAAHAIQALPVAVASTDTPATPLLQLVQQVDAGLVVMGAFGQPVVREFLLGSTTRTMLRETQIPLFVSN